MNSRDLAKLKPGDRVRWKRGSIAEGYIEIVKNVIRPTAFGDNSTRLQLVGYDHDTVFCHDDFTKA